MVECGAPALLALQCRVKNYTGRGLTGPDNTVKHGAPALSALQGRVKYVALGLTVLDNDVKYDAPAGPYRIRSFGHDRTKKRSVQPLGLTGPCKWVALDLAGQSPL